MTWNRTRDFGNLNDYIMQFGTFSSCIHHFWGEFNFTNVSITKTPTLLDGEASMHSHRTVLTLQQAIIFSHLKEDVAYFLKLPIKHQ